MNKIYTFLPASTSVDNATKVSNKLVLEVIIVLGQIISKESLAAVESSTRDGPSDK